MKSAIDNEIRSRLKKNQTRRQISDALHVGPNRISRIRKQMQAEVSSATPPEPQDPHDIILNQITEMAENVYHALREAWEKRDITNPHWVRAYSQLVTVALKVFKFQQELTPETPRQVIELVVGDLPPREGDGWRLESETPDYDPDAEEPPL